MDPRYILGPAYLDPNLGPDISGPYLGSTFHGPYYGPILWDQLLVQVIRPYGLITQINMWAIIMAHNNILGL